MFWSGELIPSWVRGVELGPPRASAYPSGSDSWFAEKDSTYHARGEHEALEP